MCKGIYSATPCELFVEAVVGIASLASRNARTISFLVDTGATCTIISATDATRLGLSYDGWWRPTRNNKPLPRAPEDGIGVGGPLKLYELDNIYITLISHTNGSQERHTEYIDKIYVASPKYQDYSLMGMDLLKRFRLLVDPSGLMVDLTRIPIVDTFYIVQNS